jgi:phosphoribosylanthranilate isomerase
MMLEVPTKVKICGITNPEDAQAAAQAGADAIGFNFFPASPRHVTPSQAAPLAHGLPPWVVRTGVFVNALAEEVQEAITQCGLSMLQFHGEETPEYCRQFGIMSMKAFRVREKTTLEELQLFPTDAWLLDAWSDAGRGGTGKSFDWDFAARAVVLGRPVFLAGGLTAENVARAIRQVRPYAVDVSSGVESSPGKKDHDRIRRFIEAVRGA